MSAPLQSVRGWGWGADQEKPGGAVAEGRGLAWRRWGAWGPATQTAGWREGTLGWGWGRGLGLEEPGRGSRDGGQASWLVLEWTAPRARPPTPPPPSPHRAPQPGGDLPPRTLCSVVHPHPLPLTTLRALAPTPPFPVPPASLAPHHPVPPPHSPQPASAPALPLHNPPPRLPPLVPLTAPPAPPPVPSGPPSAPRDLQYSLSRSPLALRLRWLPPADSGGRSDVTYSLLCLRCGREGPGGACEPCGPRVAFVPRQAGLRERAATLLHLRPGARYTVRVAALNGVSGPAAAAGATYAQVTVSTGPGGKAARPPRSLPSLPAPAALALRV